VFGRFHCLRCKRLEVIFSAFSSNKMNIIIILRNTYSCSASEGTAALAVSDRNIISEAIDFKNAVGGKITAVLFADDAESSVNIIREACSYGIDEGYQFVAEGFDFNDTKRFAVLIAETVKKYFSSADIVMFGRIACNGDACEIAAMTAWNIGIPAATYCREFEDSDGQLMCTEHVENDTDVQFSVSAPMLIQSIRTAVSLYQPSVMDIISAYSDENIRCIDLGKKKTDTYDDPAGAELIDRQSDIAEEKRTLRWITGSNDREKAINLIRILRELGFEAHDNIHNRVSE